MPHIDNKDSLLSTLLRASIGFIGNIIIDGFEAAPTPAKAQRAKARPAETQSDEFHLEYVPLALFGCGTSGVGSLPVRGLKQEETEEDEPDDGMPKGKFGDVDDDRLYKWKLHEGSITGEGANQVCKVQLTLTDSRYVGSGEDSNVCRALKQFKSQHRIAVNTMEAARRRFHEVMKDLQKNTDESDGRTCTYKQWTSYGDSYSYHFTNASACERASSTARELESAETKYEDQAVAARRALRNDLSSVKPEKQSPLDKGFKAEDSESSDE